jgi:predicted 2-oxoglutarate/Fe(II)-dependent dioxygenase YbiX
MSGSVPPHLVIDDFLAPAQVAALLGYALANETDFVPAGELIEGTAVANRNRVALRCSIGLGPHREAFVAAIHARFADACAATGVALFAIARTETELVAHGHGGRFDLHHDTLTQTNRAGFDSDRVLSSVFYFHREPKAFSGGELAIYPFRPGEPLTIAPQQNRLVLFSAIAPHAVHPVACPSRAFADSRFSVNCWLHRARPLAGGGALA